MRCQVVELERERKRVRRVEGCREVWERRRGEVGWRGRTVVGVWLLKRVML